VLELEVLVLKGPSIDAKQACAVAFHKISTLNHEILHNAGQEERTELSIFKKRKGKKRAGKKERKGKERKRRIKKEEKRRENKRKVEEEEEKEKKKKRRELTDGTARL